MELLILTFPAALLAGLSFGAGACSIGCLPLLGPILLDGGGRASWRLVLPFSLGRLTGYTLLGAVAGAFGYGLSEALGGYGGALLGAASIIAGVALLRRRPRQCAGAVELRRAAPRALQPSLFGMGMGMAFSPCAPLATVLTAASAAGSAGAGAWIAFGFGLGAVIAPTLLAVTVIAHLGAELRAQLGAWREPAQKSAAFVLMGIGALAAGGLLRF